MDRYITYCSSRRPPHICTHGPPLKRRCGTRILRNPVCSLSISLLLLFLPSQRSSPSVHPIRSLYLLAALFDFIYLFAFTKGISTITLRHTALARKCYHNDCLSFGTNTTVLFNILENDLAAAHLCIAIRT